MASGPYIAKWHPYVRLARVSISEPYRKRVHYPGSMLASPIDTVLPQRTDTILRGHKNISAASI